MSGYVELQVTSNFSFLRGASHPESWRWSGRARHDAFAIADRNSLAASCAATRRRRRSASASSRAAASTRVGIEMLMLPSTRRCRC